MSGNYSTTFYATGVSIFISGAMVVPVAKSTACLAFSDESTVVSSSSSSSSSAPSRPSSPLAQPLDPFSFNTTKSTAHRGNLDLDLEKGGQGQRRESNPNRRPSSTQPPPSSSPIFTPIVPSKYQHNHNLQQHSPEPCSVLVEPCSASSSSSSSSSSSADSSSPCVHECASKTVV